jgi:hypothetical protein
MSGKEFSSGLCSRVKIAPGCCDAGEKMRAKNKK